MRNPHDDRNEGTRRGALEASNKISERSAEKIGRQLEQNQVRLVGDEGVRAPREVVRTNGVLRPDVHTRPHAEQGVRRAAHLRQQPIVVELVLQAAAPRMLDDAMASVLLREDVALLAARAASRLGQRRMVHVFIPEGTIVARGTRIARGASKDCDSKLSRLARICQHPRVRRGRQVPIGVVVDEFIEPARLLIESILEFRRQIEPWERLECDLAALVRERREHAARPRGVHRREAHLDTRCAVCFWIPYK